MMAELSMLSTCKGSDLEHDFCCYVCEENGTKTEACYFCEKCSRCYCESCHDQHSQIFKKHNAFGREEQWRWQVEFQHETPATFFHCQKHSNQNIQLVCKDHDQLLCEKCDLSSHRKCRVDRIADIVKWEDRIPGLQQLLCIIESKQGHLDQFKVSRRTEIQESEATSDKQFADIEMFRQQIEKSLNRLEAKAKKDLVDLRVRLKTLLETDVDKCCVVKQKLELLKNALTKFGGSPESFYIADKTIQELTLGTEFLNESYKPKRGVKPKFTPKTIIEQYVSSMSVFGNITCEEPSASDEIISVTRESFHDVRYKDEKSTCCITDMCELPSGGILIMDSNNKSVKLLDTNYYVIAYLSLSNSPTSICLIDSSQVAISFYNSIDFVTVYYVQHKLVKKRSLYLDHECTSIAHSNSSLFVTTGKELYIYAIDGRRIKKLYSDSSASSTVSRCAVSTDGEKIYVVNRNNSSLLRLSRNGDVLATLSVGPVNARSYDIRYGLGLGLYDMFNVRVHVAKTGQILVCCDNSQSIFQVNTECTKILATLCMKQYFGKQSLSVCYSKVNSSIIVGIDQILVLNK